MTVNQTSGKAILNWQGFSVGQGGTVQFNNGSGATLNRVTGSSVSSIDGTVSATGSVYLINPNGVIIGQSGVVNTGGTFVASTLDVADSAFIAGGGLTFTGTSTASVMNLGKVGSLGGDVVLVGSTVSNSGDLSAAKGTVGLLGGQTVLLRDQTLSDGKFAVLVGGASTSATNGGTIEAASAELRAQGGNIYALAGNTNGVITATGVSAADGKVWLVTNTGTTTVAGSITATGVHGAPGAVETSGHTVQLETGVQVTTGNWLLKAASFTLDQPSVDDLAYAITAGASVTVQASGASSNPGDIEVDRNVQTAWTGAGLLTLSAFHDIDIDQNVSLAPGLGGITLRADNTGTGSGTVKFGFGAGIESAGDISIYYNPVSYTDPATHSTGRAGASYQSYDNPYVSYMAGTGVLYSYMLINSAQDLVAVGNETDGIYALSKDIDLLNVSTATTTQDWETIGGFTGLFDGQGHVIANMAISDGGSGLFNYNGGEIRNLGLTNVNISYQAATPSFTVGAIAGTNEGVLQNVYSTGSVIGTNEVGGLVGQQDEDGVIGNSWSSAAVTVVGGGYAGGLVGQNNNIITTSYATGRVSSADGFVTLGGLVGVNAFAGVITDSYSSGSVEVRYIGGANLGGADAGGFVGDNEGQISDSYSLGDVTLVLNNPVSNGSSTSAGGSFAGYESSSGSVTATYATGGVSVSDVSGAGNPISTGYIGYSDPNSPGTLTNSYYDANTSGASSSSIALGGLTPLSSTAFADPANFTGFNFTNTPGATGNAWVIVDSDGTLNGHNGATRPMLASEYSTTIDSAHQLELMAMNLGGAYTIGSNVDASATSSTTDVWGVSNQGFAPIGTRYREFTGSLEGQGFQIDGLYISRGGANYVGLFGGIAASGSVDNVDLENASIVGNNFVGAFSGYDAAGVALTNLTLNGSAVSGANDVGGVVGYNAGSLTGVDSTNTTVGTNYVGGIVGYNAGDLISTQNNGLVSGADYVGGVAGWSVTGILTDIGVYASTVNGSDYVGGLVGYFASGAINSGEAGDDVTATGMDAGGIAGYSAGTIYGSSNFTPSGVGGHVFGNASGASNVGGLVGYEAVTGMVSYDEADGNVTATGNNVGGLIGVNLAAITNSTAVGSVSGANNVGGLAGYNSGSITSIPEGNSSQIVGGAKYVGGLVGYNTGTIGSLSAAVGVKAAVTATDAYSGGLAGYNAGLVTSATADGSVVGTSYVGGLIGYDSAEVTDSTANTTVNGTTTIGGLVGYLAAGGVVSGDTASGKVTATNDIAGGLIGYSAGAVDTSSASGQVSGRNFVGGLIGKNAGTITKITASAQAQVVGGALYVGGLTGYNSGMIGDSSGLTLVSVKATVTATNVDSGGLVGDNVGTIEYASAHGSVTGTNSVGGLVGANSGTLNAASVGTDDIVSGAGDVGGLVGYATSTSVLSADSSSGTVIATGNGVGGLVGYNLGSIDSSSAIGSVSGVELVGGLAGENGASASITNINESATGGPQTVNGSAFVGGAVGYNLGTIGGTGASIVNVNVSATTNAPIADVGGVAGINYGTINNVTLYGSVTGDRAHAISGSNPAGPQTNNTNNATVSGPNSTP